MTGNPGPRLGPDNNPGGARWCDEPGHRRLECVKNRSRGRGQCHGPAIRGTPNCRTHAGARPAVAKSKGLARISAWSALGQPADGKGIDAGVAVLGMLQQSWLRAAAYGELLRQQVVTDGEGNPREFNPMTSDIEKGGLIGFRYGAAGKDGNIYAVSEEARGLVQLEAQERDRVVRFAKTAHDMGISDRMTSLAERWGDVVITRIMVVLAGLNLTPDQEAMVPALIQAHLGTIELGAGSE